MSSVFSRKDGGEYWIHLLLTYIYLNLARVFMIVLFSPFLRRTGYGLSWKEVRTFGPRSLHRCLLPPSTTMPVYTCTHTYIHDCRYLIALGRGLHVYVVYTTQLSFGS